MKRPTILVRPTGTHRNRLLCIFGVLALALFVSMGILVSQAGAGSQTFSVLSYGAKGDGVTNDAGAIQAAINAAAPVGGTVTFPAGTFRVNSSVYLKSNISITGASGQTVLTMPAQSAQTFILDGTNLTGVTISGLTFRAAGYTEKVSGIYMVGAQNSRATGLRFEGLSYGMKLG